MFFRGRSNFILSLTIVAIVLLIASCKTAGTTIVVGPERSWLEQADEDTRLEYEIYSFLINNILIPEFIGTDGLGRQVKMLVIARQTASQLDERDLDSIARARGLDNFSQETLDDYCRKNATNNPLHDCFMAPSGMVQIVPVQDLDYLDTDLGYSESLKKAYDQYPDAQGITRLSRVGFNHDRTEAIVYIGTRRGFIWGNGGVLLLRKTDGQWGVVEHLTSWVS